MKMAAILVLSISAFCSVLLAQDVYDGPVKWEKYKLSEYKLSITFPKPPIRYDRQDLCNEKKSDILVAFAEDLVYRLAVVRRVSGGITFGCRAPTKFGPQTLENRRKELSAANAEQTLQTEGREIWRISSGKKFEEIVIVGDLAQNRWFEMTVTGRGAYPSAQQFVDSLDLTTASGIEVDEGSPQILGDSGVDTSILAPAASKKTGDEPSLTPIASDTAEPLVIASTVKAIYTDEARRKKQQGSVTLRVTFLANGGVGPITVEKGLKFGLTEQAIKAARKMAFIPQRIDGRPVTTTRPVTFTFNIY